MKVLITGGAGFIGSAVIRYIIDHTQDSVVNLDKLTYAGNLESLESISQNERYQFEHVDICNKPELERVFEEHKPDAVMHLAAESHVDRSIDNPGIFIDTNIVGTYNLLEIAHRYWKCLPSDKQAMFRFHHVSTDEVYGDLDRTDDLFTEEHPYSPSSPYSASKAASDHLVRSWQRTYNFPTMITNCSNNYGPYHFPEKLIPLTILNALEGKSLPIYGKGTQVRDWLYVEDHAKALYMVITNAEVGSTYNIGGYNEKTNLDVVQSICAILEELVPEKPVGLVAYKNLITHVQDRPGHDVRYAIDAIKIKNELGWLPEESFNTGLRKTVEWFLEHEEWSARVLDGSYCKDRLDLS